MTTILLLGKTGQVGHELRQTLASLGTLVAPDRARVDLANPDSIRSVILEIKPDVIVNAAGFTIVDEAESQPELVMQINGIAPGIIAETAKQIGALLVHYSTTFVFDGTQRVPYMEDDQPKPINAYGRSKLAGELAIQACGGDHIIIRASWTYSSRRTNFVLKILELARSKQQINVVDDQIGAPTWARAYAVATAEMLKNQGQLREKCGIYNLAAQGICTRYQWAELIVDCAAKLTGARDGWANLQPTTTKAYADPAPRPLYTITDNRKIRESFGIELASWDADVQNFIHDYFDTHFSKANKALAHMQPSRYRNPT